MNRLGLMALATALLAVVAGCTGVARPNWVRPGTAKYQQSQAQQFDPFPENEPGPKIVGARPLSYQNPRAEVLRVQPPLDPLRARWLPWNWRWQ